jgi:hypothetical protein
LKQILNFKGVAVGLFIGWRSKEPTTFKRVVAKADAERRWA